ncbi:MAG: hypothetical protein HUU47_01050 [Bacteroidetes bacterium]|nr:hypothetical protein [Bacteroidota bacterium]
MEPVHIHLLINHIPILGGIFATALIFFGIILKNETVKKVAYFTFIVSALFVLPANKSGEGAEEIVEKIAGVNERMIEHHEEKADFAMWSSIITGIVSSMGLYLSYKNSKISGVISFVVFVVSLVSIYFLWGAGESGGKIRHTELSNTTISSKQNESHNHIED